MFYFAEMSRRQPSAAQGRRMGRGAMIRRGRSSRSLLLCSGAALGVVLAAGLWALIQAGAGQVRRLPDGSLLRLEAVSYGRTQAYVHGTWWQKRLFPLVSPALRERSGLWSPRSGWQMGAYASRGSNTLIIQATRRRLPRREILTL